MFAENQMHRGIRTHQPPRLGSVRCRRIFYHHPPVVSQDNLGATGYAVGAPGGGKGYRPTSDVEARNAIIALGITFMKRCRQFYDTHGEELFSKLIGELDRACGGCKGPNAITVNYWRGFNISMFQNWQTGNGMTIPDTIQMQTAIIDLLLADATPELLIETMAGQGEPTLAGCERIAKKTGKEFSLYQAAQSPKEQATETNLPECYPGQCGRRVPAVDPDNPIQNLADAIRELEYSEGNKDY